MSILQAIILGLVQGLSEFLPISSSGHLELGKVLLGIEAAEDVTFTIVVHGATVLSTIVIFHKDILELFRGLFTLRWNESNAFIGKLLVSSIPILIIGLFFKDYVESFFGGKILLVGIMLLLTAGLLSFTYYAPKEGGPVTFGKSFLIGIAQAIAVLPGISRSGSTIATALLLGVDKAKAARFSFLMVLIPIIGANALELKDVDWSQNSVGIIPLAAGFVTAFLSGVVACKWMISIVMRGKLIYFAIYCALIGSVSIATALLG